MSGYLNTCIAIAIAGVMLLSMTSTAVSFDGDDVIDTVVLETVSNEHISDAVQSPTFDSVDDASSMYEGLVETTSILRPGWPTNPIWGDFEYELIENDTEVEITGYIGDDENVIVPGSIDCKPVVSIGYGAFGDCDTIVTIVIDDNVTSIDKIAFWGCDRLTTIELPSGLTTIMNQTFENCPSLTTIELPSGLTAILGGAFQYCLSLASMDLPENVSEIGISAFYQCASLTSVSLPDGIVTIEPWTFKGCRSLTSVEFGTNVETMGRAAFADCTSLESFTVPDSVTTIGESAFEACLSLESITVGENVTTIEALAFTECTALTSLELPESVSSINGTAFFFCSSLTFITVDQANPSYTSQDGMLFDDTMTTLVACPPGIPGDIVIPDGVTVIDMGALATCASMTSVTLPDSVGTIAAGAFYDCTSLESIELPEGVDRIEGLTFYGCSSLESIDISDDVETIGEYAFSRCTSLESVIIGNGVETIGDSAFEGCTSLIRLEIPASVGTIGLFTFMYCYNLTSIDVDAKNDDYVSVDGALYNKTMTTLISCPCGKTGSLTVPCETTEIGIVAFLDCPKVTTIVFEGDAPTFISGWPYGHNESLAVEFYSGAENFTTPEWKGIPSVCLYTPSAPRGLQANIDGSGISLTWTAPATDAGSNVSGYTVYRGTSLGSMVAIATVDGLSYEDGDVTSGETYHYGVTASNAEGEGHSSFETAATFHQDEGSGIDMTAIALTAAIAFVAVIIALVVTRARRGR